MSNAANHIDAIDAAIAKAKSRAAERTKNKPTAEERAEAKAQRDAERQARKAAKAAQPKPTAHMKKVANAAAKLPGLNDSTRSIFDEAVTNLSAEQLTALALHLQHHNRVQATTRATGGVELKVGQVVRITGGDPKYIGMTGAIETLRRIRCFVAVPGAKRPVYIFTSECEPVAGGQELPETEQVAETGTGF